VMIGFSIIIALIIIIMSFGYKLRLFYLFGLEPPPKTLEGSSTGMVKQGIEEIREEIKKLKETPAHGAPRPSPPNIPSLSAEKVEEIVYQAVASHLPPPRAPAPPPPQPAIEDFIEPEIQAVAQSVSHFRPPPPRKPGKAVDMVDSQTQSTPKPQKKLSTTHVASYSYAGGRAQLDSELTPEKTVTRDSSVVIRDNWSQTWITSGDDGKFNDLDDITFCNIHPSWKPYQRHYVSPCFLEGESEVVPAAGVSSNGVGDGQECKHDDTTCTPSDLLDAGNVLSPRPSSRPSSRASSRPPSRPASRTSSTNFSVSGCQTMSLDPETLGGVYRRKSRSPQPSSDSSGYRTFTSSSSGALNLSTK